MFSSVVTDSTSSTKSLLTITISMVLFSSPSTVVLFLVITPELFPPNPLITIRACLFSIPANSFPFGDCLCVSYGIHSDPSLLFASKLINIDFPANPALAISSSRAWKKGNLSSRDHDSCGPYPYIIRISLPLIQVSTTMSSNSSLYSSTKTGFKAFWTPIIVPPEPLLLIDSNTSQSSIINFPFFLKWVSCSVNIPACKYFNSLFRLWIFNFRPAALAVNRLRQCTGYFWYLLVILVFLDLCVFWFFWCFISVLIFILFLVFSF